jgi:hypothetical protein
MEVKLQAYKGLIRPVLEYASTAWDPHQSYLHEKLEKVEKRAARFITSGGKRFQSLPVFGRKLNFSISVLAGSLR